MYMSKVLVRLLQLALAAQRKARSSTTHHEAFEPPCAGRGGGGGGGGSPPDVTPLGGGGQLQTVLVLAACQQGQAGDVDVLNVGVVLQHCLHITRRHLHIVPVGQNSLVE